MKRMKNMNFEEAFEGGTEFAKRAGLVSGRPAKKESRAAGTLLKSRR
jgi:hypothetical protein